LFLILVFDFGLYDENRRVVVPKALLLNCAEMTHDLLFRTPVSSRQFSEL